MAKQAQQPSSKILLPLAGVEKGAPTAARITCVTCHYWHAQADLKYGQCRRYPPAGGDLIPGQGTPATITASDYWCGEWRGKNP